MYTIIYHTSTNRYKVLCGCVRIALVFNVWCILVNVIFLSEFLKKNTYNHPFFFAVTPLDVVKIRMQSQKSNRKCFLYCNGLMDHMCYCSNGNGGVNLSLSKPANGPMSSGTIVS